MGSKSSGQGFTHAEAPPKVRHGGARAPPVRPPDRSMIYHPGACHPPDQLLLAPFLRPTPAYKMTPARVVTSPLTTLQRLSRAPGTRWSSLGGTSGLLSLVRCHDLRDRVALGSSLPPCPRTGRPLAGNIRLHAAVVERGAKHLEKEPVRVVRRLCCDLCGCAKLEACAGLGGVPEGLAVRLCSLCEQHGSQQPGKVQRWGRDVELLRFGLCELLSLCQPLLLQPPPR